MAQWCSIKVSFDTPVPDETLRLIGEELRALDYDFPVGCLTAGDFVSYRGPLIEESVMVEVLLKHGAEGRWWLTGESSPSDATENDGYCVVFRPGVDPCSIMEASRAKRMAEVLEANARRYVAITKAFGLRPIPVVWEALVLMNVYVRDGERDAFTAAVRAVVRS